MNTFSKNHFHIENIILEPDKQLSQSATRADDNKLISNFIDATNYT
ncbi:MAG: hypothetical protein AAF708_05710 [Deinococcota bacterium]